jgi:hypothetical protein
MSHSTTIIHKPPPGGGNLTIESGSASIVLTYSPDHDPEKAAKQFEKLQRMTDKVLAVANGQPGE